MNLRTIGVSAGIFLSGLLTLSLASWLATETDSTESPIARGKGTQGNLALAYQRWVNDYSSTPRSRLRIGLTWNKGLSSHYSPGRGIAEIDLASGSVRIRIVGNDDQRLSQVWLTGSRTESDVQTLAVGKLSYDEDGAFLNTHIDKDKLQSMTINRVVVTRDQDDPVSDGTLYGSLSLFQRLYHYRQRMDLAYVAQPVQNFRLVAAAQASGIVPAQFADASLINHGRDIFFNETFNGNGRTCGTCHPETNNFTLDPTFIATLPDNNPLFVAERPQPNPLARNFEKPQLMRKVGLILENTNGFGDLENNYTMRSVPHLLAMRTSVSPPSNGNDGTTLPPDQRVGWSGDGAPVDLTVSPQLRGTLRDFAVGAVRQHFTKTLNRSAGADFRLPTEYELDALEAFMLSLGRQQEFDDLTQIRMKDDRADRGRLNYLGEGLANGLPCNACHFNGGANTDPGFDFPPAVTPPAFEQTNRSFQPRVEELLDQHPDIVDAANNPFDDGFGTDTSLFNVPTVIEAADTGPFFHGNQIDTVEGLVSFYSSQRHLRNGDVLAPIVGLNGAQVANVGAFMRVVNADDNARSAIDLIDRAQLLNHYSDRRQNLKIARTEIDDALEVLKGGRLHFADAVPLLKQAKRLAKSTLTMAKAKQKLQRARTLMIQR